jgi:hypothetical protein
MIKPPADETLSAAVAASPVAQSVQQALQVIGDRSGRLYTLNRRSARWHRATTSGAVVASMPPSTAMGIDRLLGECLAKAADLAELRVRKA